MKKWYKIRINSETGKLIKPTPSRTPQGVDSTEPHWYRKPVANTDYDEHWEYRLLAPRYYNKHHRRSGWEFYK